MEYKKPVIYPKELFCIDKDITRKNLEWYDRRVSEWYATAERLYPNYFQLGLRERMALKPKIDKAAGYSI